MHITIKLIAFLQNGRFKEQERHYPPGTQVEQVLAELLIPESQCGLIILNGRYAQVHSRLNDGDVLSLLPIVDGG